MGPSPFPAGAKFNSLVWFFLSERAALAYCDLVDEFLTFVHHHHHLLLPVIIPMPFYCHSRTSSSCSSVACLFAAGHPPQATPDDHYGTVSLSSLLTNGWTIYNDQPVTPREVSAVKTSLLRSLASDPSTIWRQVTSRCSCSLGSHRPAKRVPREFVRSSTVVVCGLSLPISPRRMSVFVDTASEIDDTPRRWR